MSAAPSPYHTNNPSFLFPLRQNIVFQVAWVHLDRQMVVTVHRNVISRLARYSVSYDNHRTWMLHVSNVQQDDRGVYMCQVTNPTILVYFR